MNEAVLSTDFGEIDLLSKKLQAMQLTPAARKKLLAALGVEMETQTKERFVRKTDPDGDKWADIADSTRRYLARHYPGSQPPLVRDGNLRDTIESQVLGTTEVLAGETKEYAIYHQTGTPKMPARPSLGIGTEDAEELAEVIDDFIKRNLR